VPSRRGGAAPSRPERAKTKPGTPPAISATGPEIPAHVSADQLDVGVRAELRTLPRELADRVARHLAAAEQAGDAEIAYEHSVAARRLASRVGAVREACGVAAYLTGRWAEALSELRTARRLTGRAGYVAIMADCERALGRYDRALALVTGPDSRPADRAEEVELRIVESGIRRDMGAGEAAVVLLQLPELTDGRIRPWSARLYYAYADALLDVGRADEARDWFGRAAAADREGETDAAERFDELDDVTIDDVTIDDAEDADGGSRHGGC
jgi:tetratricopeptide (TPR) repeat protein